MCLVCLVKPNTSWTQNTTQNTPYFFKITFLSAYLHSVLAVAPVLHSASRSFDGEAVGVSEVVEGGSAFEYNKGCLKEEFVGSEWWVVMRDGLQ